MTKYLLAALAALVLALGGWGVYGHYRVGSLKALIAVQDATIQNQNTAILAHQAKDKRNTVTLKDMATRQAALVAQQKETTHALSKALAAAPDWAASPLPPSISDWVRD